MGAAAAAVGCEGSATPTAASAALSPSDSRWPNEPPGLTLLTDWGLDQDPPTAGDVLIPDSPDWSVVYGLPPGPTRGWLRRVSDPSAPVSPPHVYEFTYPQGMVEGTAPATVYFPGTDWGVKGRLMRLAGDPGGMSAEELFVGFWWKTSVPFDVGPNGNKIAFMFNGGGNAGGQQFLILFPDGRLHVLPEYPGDFNWRRPNVNATPVELGKWHRIEWYANRVTGTMKWWLDGVPQGSHTDVKSPFPFDVFQFSPTWGGNSGARKKQTDRYWFDHVRVSAR
jgi:hypothetical protein